MEIKKNVLSYTEDDLINWLLSRPILADIMKLLYPPSFWDHVQLDIHQGVRGHEIPAVGNREIDLVVFPKGKPENATTVQVKQTKITLRLNRKEKLDRYCKEKIKKGVQQSVSDIAIGFQRSYFLLVVEYDGSENYHGFFAPAPSQFDQIGKLVSTIASKENPSGTAGLSYLVVSQISSKKTIDAAGALMKPPTSLREPLTREQPSSLTRDLSKLPVVDKHYCNISSCPYTYLKLDYQQTV
ncbi:MAG: hypothetical protein WAO19_11895 [Candidatus Kryptoniota bacterium]